MTSEWVVFGCSELAAVVVLTLLQTVDPDHRKGLGTVILKPLVSVAPFLIDTYWKYETRPTCDSPPGSCTPTSEYLRQESIMKLQRNALIIVPAVLFFWLLYFVTRLVEQVEMMEERLEKLKRDRGEDS